MSASVIRDCMKRLLQEKRDAGDLACTDAVRDRCADDLCDMLVDKMAGQTFKVPLRTFRERRESEGVIQDMWSGGYSRRYISRSLRVHRRRVGPKTG